MVQRLSLLHNFIQQSLNSGSAQAQTLLAVCRRFAMVRSRLEIRIKAFRQSTIPHKQFIIFNSSSSNVQRPFSRKISRTLTGNIFCGVSFCWSQKFQAATLKRRNSFGKVFFGIFEFLEHSFLSRHFQKNLCRGVFNMVVGYRL